jgi:hypothetical protein
MTQTLKYPKIQIKSRDLGVQNIGKKKNISESHKKMKSTYAYLTLLLYGLQLVTLASQDLA